MGFKADANKDRSLVINLGKKGKQVSSNNKGEFLVNSDFFTIQIGKKEVTINKKNIKNFKKLLKKPNNGRSHLELQPAQIEQQQATNEQQQAQIKQQQGHIEKQQEQINELYRMMTARSTEN